MIRALMKECMIYKSLYPFQMHRTLVQFHVYIGFTRQKRGGLIYYSISLVVCLPDQADRKKKKKKGNGSQKSDYLAEWTLRPMFRLAYSTFNQLNKSILCECRWRIACRRTTLTPTSSFIGKKSIYWKFIEICSIASFYSRMCNFLNWWNP